MASILDAGLVGLFSAIFVFLLVYTVVWGALTWRKPLGDNKGAYAMIALAVAFIMAAAPPARAFITFVAPWYVALALVIFFVLFITLLFGLSPEKDFPSIIKHNVAKGWIIILGVVIAVAGMAFTFGQGLLGGTPGAVPDAGYVPPGGVQVIGGNGAPYQEPGTIAPTPGGGYYPASPYPAAGTPGSTATPDFATNLINTLIHPKVLGLLITMFIAAIAVYFLSSGP